jgi:hypothetical protein
MNLITRAGAWCNGEVAYIAWDVKDKIPNCVGFMVTRIHETGEDAGQRRILPTWVAFTDQNNPNWNEQDSSVWPIQNFEWRDLTLRKSRDTTNVRPIDFKVYYEIVPRLHMTARRRCRLRRRRRRRIPTTCRAMRGRLIRLLPWVTRSRQTPSP